MALIVRNTDIINNTGITLANPTGVAGTYALAFSIQNLGVSMIAGGGTHTMAITSDGQLRGWGSNSKKEVNPASANYTWTDITYTILENVKQVACGSQFTMALLSNGELRGWGNNASRQCNPDSSTSPWADINHTILSGVKSVACCENHTVVLMEDGTVRGWGANSSRESYPASATNPWTDSSATIISGAAEVSAGNEHTIILMEDGTVHGWGKNTDNQVNPNVNWLYNQIWTDVEEVILSGAKQVSAGSSHSGALLGNGNLLMWGSNGYKQCNPASSNARYTNIADPILVNVGQVSCGEANTHALLMNGNVVGWGLNNTKAAYPASATSPWTDNTAVIISGVESLSVGRGRFALFSDGSVRGWGGNRNRQCNPASATNPWTDSSTEIFNTSLIPATLSWGGGTAQQITEDGVYTLSDGSNTIEATVDYSALAAEDTTDNVRVTGAVYISITPYMKRISAGQTQQFTATMIDNEGNAVDVTNEVVWASSDTDIATINSSGLATGLAEGDVTISATML